MKVLKFEKGQAHVKRIEGNLKGYYEALNCDLIDIIEIKINNKYYSIILDQEGKLKENHIPNLIFINKHNKIIDYIANDFIICNTEETDDRLIEASLKDSDIKELLNYFKSCKHYIDFENNLFVPTITIE